MLKANYGYSAEQVIHHNLFVAVVALLSSFIYAVSSIYVHPLRILILKTTCALVLAISTPFLLFFINTPQQLLLFQCVVIFFSLSGMPGHAIFLKAFPVLKRMTRASMVYAVARALMLIVTSIGSIYTLKWFGNYGLWVISLPVCLSFLWGINYFRKLANPKTMSSSWHQPAPLFAADTRVLS